MSSDVLGIGRKTPGSPTVVIPGMMRNQAGVLTQTLLSSFWMTTTQEEELSGPVQSSGSSRPSQRIGDYLNSALADFSELASEVPKRIRMTSSPKARAAQMDPWKVKNGRRIRLIKKRYREGINAQESAELERLTKEVSDHVRHVSPRSTAALDEFADFVSGLRAEVEKKKQQP